MATPARDGTATDISAILYYQAPPSPASGVRVLAASESWWPYSIPISVPIRNGRSSQRQLTLDTVGFTKIDAPTAFQDFSSDARVVESYYPEMARLLKAATGTKAVLVLKHSRFHCAHDVTPEEAMQGGSAKSTVAACVHTDTTEEWEPVNLEKRLRAGDYWTEDEEFFRKHAIEEIVASSHIYINIWRNTSDTPVERMPLAVCDASSVGAQDRFRYRILPAGGSTDILFENYSLCAHRAEHAWYYFPRLTKDECLMFKNYDSRLAPSGAVFHTAFHDPTTSPDAAARESIVVKAAAFFG